MKKYLIFSFSFALFVMPARKLFSQVNLNVGLIAYYPFNGDATDQSGNGNNASFNNATLTTDRFGNANSAYYFNGVDNYIQIPNSASLNPTNAMSIALYFNPSQNGVQTLVGKIGYTAGVGTQFQTAIDFSLYPGILFGVNPIANGCSNPPLNAAYVNTASSVTTNQWYCLVGTFDNGVMNIYLNGTLIQTTNAGFNTLNQCSNADIQIGSWWSGDLQRFMGKIDDVRIYNRAINQQEVNALCPLCTQPQGSLSGNTICSGANGMLTYNSTTGTAPFTIQYSDGTNTFTQNNVTSGTPFSVVNNPVATTTYTLISVTDATGCSRTTGFVSGVTTIVVNNCAVCSAPHCSLVNSLLMNTGYNIATQTALLPTQKDTNWIITAISDDLKNAYCYANTAAPTAPSSMTPVPPVTVGQAALTVQPLPNWPQTGSYVSCFPYNTIYTNTPSVSNFTNATMGITRTFYICSNNSENINFNLNLATDDYTTSVIVDAGTANPIILFTGATTFSSPLSINITESLSPGMHTLTVTGADYEDLNGSYFTLPSGITAQWNPFGISVTGSISSVNNVIINNSCTPVSLCTGSLGDPVVNITFGSGNNPGQDLPTIVPGASTSLTYVAVTGNPASPTPVDGQYTITNNVPFNGDWYSGASNHTPNDPNGYMAFYNASEQPGEFYKQTVNDLCGSTTYEFAAWIANVLDPSKVIGVNPDITFRIEQTDGTLLASFDTGPIAQNSTFTWQQFGFYFTMPSNISTVVLRMINNNPGGVANLGNDLAIDDITFRPCGPLITASFNASSILDSISVCQGSNVKLYGTASSGYVNPGYLWQYSADSGRTWTDIANSNMLQINVSAPSTNAAKNYKYRMLSGENNNINSVNCRIVSNLTILNVIPGPQGKLSAANICPDKNANVIFTSSSPSSPFSIIWTDGTNTYPQTNLSSNSSFTTPFTLASTASFKLHSVTDANGCTNNLDSPFTITVNPLPKGYFTGDDICAGDDAVLLFTSTSGSPLFNISYSANGNAYTQTGVDNNSTFTVPFQLNSSTNFKLTSITDANGCTATLDTSASINVLPLPQGGLTDATACTGDSAGITFNSSIGTGPFEVEISDGTNTTVYYGVSSGIPFNIAPVTQTTTISLVSITDKDGDGCTRTSGFTSPTATITAKPSPEIEFDPLTAICIQQAGFLITQAKETTGVAGNGIFSGDGVDATGNFDPISAGVGTHKITYTYNASNGCSAIDSSNITVNPTPIVSAGTDIITCLGFTVQLNATGASTYVWSPTVGLDNPAIKNPVATLDSTTTYIVLGTDSNGCYASDTVTISVGKNGIAAFVVPNAFTPNGDGVNDCFGIRRWGGVTVVEFDIFNRWGELIFTTKNPSDCWDGTFKGKLQPTGGYPYIIKAKTPCGDVTRTGIVILAR